MRIEDSRKINHGTPHLNRGLNSLILSAETVEEFAPRFEIRVRDRRKSLRSPHSLNWKNLSEFPQVPNGHRQTCRAGLAVWVDASALIRVDDERVRQYPV